MQFLDTAYKLYIYTVQQCTKFPKRYTFYVSQPIALTAHTILDSVKRANSIFPTNEHEAQMRRDCFIQAYSSSQSLITQINAATELFPVSSGALTAWMELIQSELYFLKGIMKRDKARYKDILQDDEDEETPVNADE